MGRNQHRREVKAIVERATRTRELLREFGLVLRGIDPGVSASIAATPGLRGDGYFGEAISFNGIEWGWLMPLLEELSQRRRADAMLRGNVVGGARAALAKVEGR